QTAIRRAREIRYSALDLTGVAQIDRNHLHPERRRDGLYRSELGKLGGIGRIPKDSHPAYVRRDLFEQLQPFPANSVVVNRETGSIGCWAREAFDEAGTNRIDGDRKYDRNRAGRLKQWRHGGVAGGEDDIGCERWQ